MKVKKVNQYQCKYCGKKQYSAGHMRTHEKHCTMNPERHCRMCDFMEESQPEMSDLLAMFPDESEYVSTKSNENESDDGVLIMCELYNEYDSDVLNKVLIKLRGITECPACIMSALRQKGIPVPEVTNFDYKAESERIFDDAREQDLARTNAENYMYT